MGLTFSRKPNLFMQGYGIIGPNVFLTDETRHKRPTGIKERAIPRRGGGGGVSGKTVATPSTGSSGEGRSKKSKERCFHFLMIFIWWADRLTDRYLENSRNHILRVIWIPNNSVWFENGGPIIPSTDGQYPHRHPTCLCTFIMRMYIGEPKRAFRFFNCTFIRPLTGQSLS